MSTAAAGLVLSAASLAANPAFAANECGTPSGGAVTCTSAGNPYATGITYTTTGTPLTVTADSTVNATGPLLVTGTGADVAIDNAGVFNTGTTAVAAGIGAQSTGGNVTITHSGSVTTNAANSTGVFGIATGNVLITSSGTVSAQGATSDGIDAISTAGTTTVNITGGTVSATEFGVGMEGPVASTATSTLTNAGTLTGDTFAVFTPATATSGAATITNTGTMNGAISLNGTGSTLTTGNTVNNSGTWNVSADSNFGPTTGTTAPNVVNNTGTIVVNPNNVVSSVTNSTETTFTALSAFNNAGGTIDLRTGNNLTMASTTFVGGTGSQLLVLANGKDGVLTVGSTPTVVNGAPVTSVQTTDVLGTAPGLLNLNGTLLVQGASSNDAFILDGNPNQVFHKGFVDYELIPSQQQNGSWTYTLFGLPGREVFEALSVPYAAQTYWLNSANAWTQRAMSIRDSQLWGATPTRAEGWEVWMVPYGGHQEFARPQIFSFQGSAAGAPVFTFDSIGTNSSFFGLQAGADILSKMEHGYGYWGFTGGVEQQETDFEGDIENNLYLIGGNIGMYGGINWNGLYFDGLGKVDFIDLNTNFNSAAFSPSTSWMTWGGKGEIGYRWPVWGVFVEPSARVAGVWTNQNNLFPDGNAIHYNISSPIVQGQVGGRIGYTLTGGIPLMGSLMGFLGHGFDIYGGAWWADQWSGRNGMTFVSGPVASPTVLNLVQRQTGSYIRAEYGVETTDFFNGGKIFFKGENDFNGEGFGGWSAQAGVRFSF